MKNTNEEQIQRFEERLKKAMLNSDVAELDDLLAPELIFTNHLGQLMNKQDDLNIHKSGKLKIQEIDFSDQRIIMAESVAIVSVQARVVGNFSGALSESVLRFTRIWQEKSKDCWHVIAAHSSMVIV